MNETIKVTPTGQDKERFAVDISTSTVIVQTYKIADLKAEMAHNSQTIAAFESKNAALQAILDKIQPEVDKVVVEPAPSIEPTEEAQP